MGWFWDDSNGKNDPTKNLDPSLKDYLEKETPAKYTPTTAISSEPPSQPSQKGSSASQPSSTTSNTQQSKPAVPSASLFPDGRYAHIWKDYKPLEEIEGPSISPAEKVVDQFKQRKSVLNKAALENCSEEHMLLTTCFQNGDLGDKMRARITMCRDENRKFSRCYTIQAKFLQALGYGSDFEWDSDKQEQVQMHADKLYHQMLDYEKRVEEAKAAGQQPPPPQSLFNPNFKPAPKPTTEQSETSTSSSSDALEIPGVDQVPQGVKFQKPLKDLTPHERELEIQVVKQKMQQQQVYYREVSGMLNAEDLAKEKRRQKFAGWFGETVGNWLA
ncbi:hypothetical protein AJ80_00359 [Polytolypa hystricis UAMH7299]|uniref:Uncharacterized protein n=1 Tax=Polytolypa hystricis (strain UAMH7299) TaxID=1447883 RepID=A0A2B7Z413_POLH7|nr:hypothetical protein AJ80_00359 [Polytolypa hystricis UAMH7299]